MDTAPRIKRIAFVGDYIPRQCGIATFTADLCESIAQVFPETHCSVGAVNDREEGYAYTPRVRFELNEKEIESYRRAADFLNINNVEVVSLQHEFGIFGGPSGSHIIALLRELNMPVVTTLHTVLKEPSDSQRLVMEQLAKYSARFVVMAQKGVDFLRDIYDIPAEKIDLIPHGIPDISFIDPNFYKDQFGVDGKTVLLTFGLLSPNKGIEYVIEALPKILERYPDVVYIVLGATHPNLLAHEGEAYRLGLERLAEARGVKKNVIFYNRFVQMEELKEFIGATDIYITPYLNEGQITSGTLAYTFGAGKAVISTPYWHAEELLAENRGVLVPFANADRIAQAVIDLMADPSHCNAMRKNAYLLGREMIWPAAAKRYMESFVRAKASRHVLSSRKAFARQTLENQPYQLPAFKLDHLQRMTDSTGILQHATFNVPNYSHGYCIDDNARAFLLTVLLEELGRGKQTEIDRLSTIYLAFIAHAMDRETGRFRNFMSYGREWLEKAGSEDSHCRAMWALGAALGRSQNQGRRALCGNLFEIALPVVEDFTSPRALAFALIAIHEYLRSFAGDRAANTMREKLSEKLIALYHHNKTKNWSWFEPIVAYDNAILSHALLLTGYWTSQHDTLEIGLESLRWLTEIQTSEAGFFNPIGSNGFYKKGGTPAQFDQQPLEAYSMLSACLEAYRITNDSFWLGEANRAFEWYLGRNVLATPLYDATNGGCHDALHADRINRNQGAESTLAFCLSLAEMNLAQHIISPTANPPKASAKS